MIKGLFGGLSVQRTEHDQTVKQWVREAFVLPEEATVLLTELRCQEAGCPPVETVIAIFTAVHPTLHAKLHKPLAEVTQADITALAVATSPVTEQPDSLAALNTCGERTDDDEHPHS